MSNDESRTHDDHPPPRDSNDYADDLANKAAKPGATDMPHKQRGTARSAYGQRLPAKSTMET